MKLYPASKLSLYGLCLGTLLSAASVTQAEEVEITLADELDGIKSGYCLDIARGQKENADPANGLQAHTCYSHEGELSVDQIFDTEKLTDNVLYMPKFDVCATLTDLDVGAGVGLSACDDSEEQQFVMADNGTITPAANTELCLTASGETTTGRSKTNLMRSLSLQPCSDDSSALQAWRTRTEDD